MTAINNKMTVYASLKEILFPKYGLLQKNK